MSYFQPHRDANGISNLKVSLSSPRRIRWNSGTDAIFKSSPILLEYIYPSTVLVFAAFLGSIFKVELVRPVRHVSFFPAKVERELVLILKENNSGWPFAKAVGMNS